ncbi:MAG: PHB accumulation regulatory domain-containing protein, partial [Fretibacterium sp.]
MATYAFTAVIHREDDWYVAECPEVGTASQGVTLEESIANLREATELYLEEAGGAPMFSEQLLANLIRFYGHAMQGLMG